MSPVPSDNHGARGRSYQRCQCSAAAVPHPGWERRPGAHKGRVKALAAAGEAVPERGWQAGVRRGPHGLRRHLPTPAGGAARRLRPGAVLDTGTVLTLGPGGASRSGHTGFLLFVSLLDFFFRRVSDQSRFH